MKKKIVVLGAGVTGLAATYKLAKQRDCEVALVDQKTVPGGTCQSFHEGEFTLDYGPHKFYTLLPGILDELKVVMGDELLEVEKAQSLYMLGKYFTFPLKMTEMLRQFPPMKSFSILASYAMSIVHKAFSKADIESYEQYITSRFGKGLYKQIFEPMAQKIYGDPSRLDKRLAEVRISSPGLMSVVKQMLFRSQISREISAPTFHYPRQGFGRIPDRLWEKSKQLGATGYFGYSVKEIHHNESSITGVTLQKGNSHITLDCDNLLFTIPLDTISQLMPRLESKFRSAATKMRYRNTIVQYYLLKSKPLLPSMWVFFPESQFRFGRLSETTKFSKELAPQGHTALMVDFTCLDDDAYWSMDDSVLSDRLYKQMEPLRLFEKSQVIKSFSRRIPKFYPVYDVGFTSQLERLRSLETQFENLSFIGRLGDFNYNNSDQCLDMGFRAAEHISSDTSVVEWNKIRTQHFDKYKIVD